MQGKNTRLLGHYTQKIIFCILIFLSKTQRSVGVYVLRICGTHLQRQMWDEAGIEQHALCSRVDKGFNILDLWKSFVDFLKERRFIFSEKVLVWVQQSVDSRHVIGNRKDHRVIIFSWAYSHADLWHHHSDPVTTTAHFLRYGLQIYPVTPIHWYHQQVASKVWRIRLAGGRVVCVYRLVRPLHFLWLWFCLGTSLLPCGAADLQVHAQQQEHQRRCRTRPHGAGSLQSAVSWLRHLVKGLTKSVLETPPLLPSPIFMLFDLLHCVQSPGCIRLTMACSYGRQVSHG